MSYSFSFTAKDKDEAKQKLAEAMKQATASQAYHDADRVQATAAAESFIDVLPDDDAKDVSVSMNGTVAGNWIEGDKLGSVVSASVSITVRLVDKH